VAVFFYPFLSLIRYIIPGDFADASLLPPRLALFHTLFNLFNTALFIPFVSPFSRLVAFLVKPRKNEETARYKLVYTAAAGPRQAPEINILKAELEIKKMAELLEEMFPAMVQAVLSSPKHAREGAAGIDAREEYLAVMYEEISQFLVHCSRENISTRNLEKLNLLIRICNETASIGDCCKKLAACALVKAGKKIEFDRQGAEEIKTYADMVKKFLVFNREHLGLRMAATQLMEAEAMENAVDNSRDILRKASQKRLKAGHAHVKTEILFIDILRHIEHIGDHSFEISRALYKMNSGQEQPAAPPLPVQV
jgi:phosphate:Na+ symporter